MVDMHIHTTFSDGNDDLEKILEHTKNYDLFSVTDHNNIMSSKLVKADNYVTGVELSISPLDLGILSNVELHLLAYNYNPNDKRLNEIIDEFTYYNNLIYLKILTNIIVKNKLKIDLDKFKNLIDQNVTITKLHLIKILIENGYGNEFYETFNRYVKENLYEGVKHYYFKCSELIDIMKKSGAYLLLAHPYSYGMDNDLDKLIKKLYDMGIDGIEMDSKHYIKIQEYIKKYNFIYSVGSDYHGKEFNKCNLIGIDDTLYCEDNQYIKNRLLFNKN